MRLDENLCARECRLFAQALPLLAAFLVTSCGIFQGKPALPRNPVVETVSDSSQNQFTAAMARADVIYFQDDRQVANSGQNTELKILDALQAHDARLAIGWASVDLTQQALLNQWQEQKISAEELLAHLPSAEVAQMAPADVDLVRQTLRPDIAQLALGCPRDFFTKVRLGEKLSDEERAMIPSGFTTPPNDFENFSDEISDVPRLRRYNIRDLYRACRISEQMAAETIVKYITENPRTKLLVILHRGYRINPRNVSHYVAEKGKLRQLILDRSSGLAPARPNLLTLGSGSRHGCLL
jgi:uncharacterized iron-regulated protein